MKRLATTLALTTLASVMTTTALPPVAHAGPTAQTAGSPVPPVAAPASNRVQVKLRSTTGRTVGALDRLVASGAVSDVRPLITVPPEQLRTLQAQARTAATEEQPDLAAWLVARVAPGRMAATLDALRADPAVENATEQPVTTTPLGTPAASVRAFPSAVGATTPDLTDHQVYAGPVGGYGIDARAAHSLPGGKGQNVAVADIEFAWDTRHEDLNRLTRNGAVLPVGTPEDPFGNSAPHGTGVMGVLVADENTGGLTGLVPQATPYLVNAYSSDRGYSVAAAVALAASRLSPGDVVLIEQQLGSDACNGTMGPVELDQATYDAITVAVAKGIHVIEAAGNGSLDLDVPCYASAISPAGGGDSGAIMVGAAAGSLSGTRPGTRLSFSNHGKRVDVHAWGETVATTGWGADLYDGGPHREYGATFAGTSSASPIVAAAVAQISSIAEEQGRTVTPAQMRSALASTGSQGVAGQGVGTLPNVPQALAALGLDGAGVVAAVPNGDFEQGPVLWTGRTSAITTLGYPASQGSWKAALGGYGRVQGDDLETTITVPASGASIAYDLRVVTRDPSTWMVHDRLRVQVVDASGDVVKTLATHSNLEASASYSVRTASLAAFAGQSVRLRFSSSEDARYPTTFVVDSVRLTR